MLSAYPAVTNEVDTMRLVLEGRSLARYGDGELKMAHHLSGIKSQRAEPALCARLAEILSDSGNCLVGIPNIHDVIAEHVSDQKVQHWSRFLMMRQILSDRPYVSAFITRPDSAPWINTEAYWQMVESLWVGHNVTVVRGSGKSFTADNLRESGAREVREVMCPKQHAWEEYDSILDRIGTPDRVILGLGPTATVLAVDLCAKGVHAIDLGHMAMFHRKWKRGEVMQLTAEEKALPA